MKAYRPIVLILVPLVLVGVAACRAGDGEAAVDAEEAKVPVIAEVNGVQLYKPFYDQTLEYMRERVSRGQVERYLSASMEALDVVINDELLYQEAQQAGIEVADDVVRAEFSKAAEGVGGEQVFLAGMAAQGIDRSMAIEAIRKRVTIDRFVTERISENLEVSDGEILSFYNENLQRFTPEVWIHAHHILIRCPRDADRETLTSSRRRAVKILENIRAGESFSVMARDFGEDPSSPTGDLGMIKRGYEGPEFDAVAFALRPGEVSDVVQTDRGFHIILVTERTGGVAKPFEEVAERCRELVLREKQGAAIRTIVRRLRESAVIKTEFE